MSTNETSVSSFPYTKDVTEAIFVFYDKHTFCRRKCHYFMYRIQLPIIGFQKGKMSIHLHKMPIYYKKH